MDSGPRYRPRRWAQVPDPLSMRMCSLSWSRRSPSKQGPDHGAIRSVARPPSKGGTVPHQVGDRGQERLGEPIDPRGGEVAGVDEEGGVGEPLVDEHAVDAVAGGE